MESKPLILESELKWDVDIYEMNTFTDFMKLPLSVKYTLLKDAWYTLLKDAWWDKEKTSATISRIREFYNSINALPSYENLKKHDLVEKIEALKINTAIISEQTGRFPISLKILGEEYDPDETDSDEILWKSIYHGMLDKMPKEKKKEFKKEFLGTPTEGIEKIMKMEENGKSMTKREIEEPNCERWFIIASVNQQPFGGVFLYANEDHPGFLRIESITKYIIPRIYLELAPEDNKRFKKLNSLLIPEIEDFAKNLQFLIILVLAIPGQMEILQSLYFFFEFLKTNTIDI